MINLIRDDKILTSKYIMKSKIFFDILEMFT